MCSTHPHRLSETLTEEHRLRYTCMHKNTHCKQSSKYNNGILTPFSPGWWQVFFFSTWLKWNPIISVMALQLLFCCKGGSLLESPLLDLNVFSKSVMPMVQMCNGDRCSVWECLTVCVWSIGFFRPLTSWSDWTPVKLCYSAKCVACYGDGCLFASFN